MKEVVGTIFLNHRKVLIDKPTSKKTFQMVGGKVEEGETPLQAAIRECREELGPKVKLDESRFKQVMEFDEIATSNPNEKIHFYVFRYEGAFRGQVTTSDEIEGFVWYNTELGIDILSNTLKREVIPYLIKKDLID